MTQRGRKKIEDYRRKPLGAGYGSRTHFCLYCVDKSFEMSTWSGRGSLNPQHSRWQRDALPIELQQHIWSWWRNLNP